ncbi:hypothetical protein ARMGADRAFT_1084888 [Armillaria gallica]|uniref:Uncharacterized protein n=1 Tax=Armillaria gallica TaxID=47427 RepID=A0A2H3CZ22_ARMGA|nr:hypothetical protein ARMGADRAFT_1084888 [Armillaria gallica]
MGIFKKIRRTIASWPLVTDSESEDMDGEARNENQSIVPGTADASFTAGNSFGGMLSIYNLNTGVIIGYASRGDGGLTANASQISPVSSRALRTGLDQVLAHAKAAPASNPTTKAGPSSMLLPITHPQGLQLPNLENT